jgi:excisionase family DNA binding protein
MTTTESLPRSRSLGASVDTESSCHQALLVTPEEAARRLSLGRTTVYELMASGELPSVTIGRCRRVPVSSLHSFVARLAANATAGGSS